jgi:hypothetical protein
MKTLIGVGALLASSLLFAADAKAGIFDWFGRCPCPRQPACPAAATASVDGTTSYSPTYQPAEGARVVQPSRPAKRSKSFEDYRREIKGW